jgi:hypothetical protein
LFGIAAYRAAGWSSESGHDSIVTEQKQPANANVKVPPGEPAPAKVIPQIVTGSFDAGLTKYSTVVQVINTGATDSIVDFSFYQEDGSASPLRMATNAADQPTFTGSLAGLKLAANKVLVISGGTTPETTPQSGMVGWAKLAATGHTSISTYFEIKDGHTGTLYSRVSVPASRPDLSNFMIPRVHSGSAFDVAFALVNTSSASTSLTATLKDASGATLARRIVLMKPGEHQALFAHEFFAVPKETDDRTYQYILFNSNSRSFAAIALAFEGNAQTSFPVEPLE